MQIAANQVQPVATAQQPQSAGVQAAGQSLEQVNKLAQQGFQSPTVQLTSQKTQELLKDPSQGMNYQQNINNRLTQTDRENAQALETARQGMAGAAGSSINQQSLMQLALQNNEKKADLQTELETQAADQKQKAMLAALAEGRATSATEQNQYNTNIDALVKARQAADPEIALTQQSAENALNRGLDLAMANQNAALQTSLAELDAKVKQGMQLKEQDFTASQNELNRSLQTALQANDINATRSNIETQLAFDKWKTESGYQFTAEQNAINNTLQLTLKNLDIDSTKALTELKAKLDSGLMTQEQDWKAAQNALDRAAAEALQKGDAATQIEITKLKGEIDSAQQKAQLQWSTSERLATQIYNSNERIETQDYNTAMKYVDQKIAAAAQDKDIELQKYLEDKKATLQLKMQTQEFDQQTKMTYLTDELATARANGDVLRQKQIIQFQTGQELEKIAATSSADKALEKLRGDIQMAIQNDDQAAVEALQKSELTFKATEAAKDRMLEQARIDLTEKQVDLAQVEQQYNQISDMVAQGILDPAAEYDFMMGTLKAHGVDTKGYNMVDAQAQAEKALQQEYELQKSQFLKTHPEALGYKVNSNSTFKAGQTFSKQELLDFGVSQAWIDANTTATLSPEGLKTFNEFMNSTLYGELTNEQKTAKANAGYLGAGDISTAAPGDKFNLTEQYFAQTDYSSEVIPPGKYSVTTSSEDSGSKFFGTKRTTTNTYLVSEETGKKYLVNANQSGTTGNIISGLWADNGGL